MAGSSAGRIDLDLELNYGAFQRQLSGISGTATNLVGSAFKGLGGIIAGAFAVKELVTFGREAINLASDLQEVQNVVDVTFGSMAQDINNWSKSMLQGFGLSELSAKKYASTMGAMMKSSGLAGVQMEGMSKKLTELSADMASFYNLSNDMAFEKIRSGISGETEPLKQLGINMSVANLEAYALSQGIRTSFQNMDQASQTLLRYNYLLSVTGDAQGDFARTSNSWANQVKLMGEQWRIFQGTMGAGFINILTPILKGLNWLIQKLQIAAQYFKAFTALLFGDSTSIGGGGAAVAPITETADAVGGMGNAAQDAGKKTKKAANEIKGSLAGFDQLNMLADKTAGSLGDAGDAAAAAGGADLGGMALGGAIDLGTLDVTVDPYMQKVQGIINDTKTLFSGLWSTIGSGWSELRPAMQPFVDMMTPISASIGSMKETMTDLWQNTLVPMGTYLLGDFIPNLVTGFTQSFAPVIANALVGAFQLLDTTLSHVSTTMNELWNTTWLPNLELVKGAMLEAMPQIAASLDSLIQNTILPAADFFLNDFALPISKTILEVFVPIFATTAAEAIRIFSDTFTHAVNEMNDLWTNTYLPNLTKLRDVILEVLPEVGAAFDKLLKEVILPFVDYMLNQFILPIQKAIVETLVPIFTDILVWAFREASDAFKWLVDLIVDIYNTIFKPTFDLIRDIVLDCLEIIKNAWEEHGTKILEGLTTFLENTKKMFRKLWDEVLKPIIEPFLKMLKDIWNDTLKGLVEKAVDLVLKLTQAAIDIYNKFIQPILDAVVKYLGPLVVDTFNSMWEGIKLAVGWIGDILSGLMTILDGLIDFIAGVFTGNWKQAWEGVKGIFKGVFESLWGIARTPLNAIIDMINKVIDGLNSIDIDIPEMFGGGHFGLNVPRIPRLARGGIVSSPTIAQIGERGKEAVVPLENTAFVDTLASALGTAVMAAMQMNQTSNSSSSGIQSEELVMQLDGTVLARLLAPYLAKEQQRTGTSLIRNITTT
ncbi:phage tail protein [Paenibacillus sp. FSL H7-0714]|uniref:phage tail protein n=1 Tax=Paenibacillus sp. FSL H7-0714 TaxID=2954735 RepID=UPI0030F9EF2D